jgi:hypothetical protein
MTKSELIEILSKRQMHLKADDVDMAVKTILEMMSNALADGDRIEIRGFLCIFVHRVWVVIPRPATRLRFPASTCRISNLAKSYATALMLL